MQTILAFIFVFGIIVIVHEFGHFYFAKRAGILVREFSIGMGPKLFQTHRNETSYTIRMLPLGGYVMMAGYEEEEDLRLGMPVLLKLNDEENVTEIHLSQEDVSIQGIPIDVLDYDFEHDLYIKGNISGNTEDVATYEVDEKALLIFEDGTKLQIAPANRQVQNASLLNRMLTNFGGPLNNFILSILAFILLAFMRGGVPSDEPIIGNIQADSPAETANLETGDRVLAINDEEMHSWMDMVLYVNERPNEPLTFEIERNNQQMEETITPQLQTTADGREVGLIGVEVYMEDSFLDKIKFGFTETWFYIQNIFQSIIQLVTGQLSIDALGGPVAIFELTGQATQTGGLLGIVSFIGFLSVNLGLMNLLPIPALDGGKIVLNLIELVRGKPLSQEKETLITLIGVVLLLILMLVVTWNDLQKFFFN